MGSLKAPFGDHACFEHYCWGLPVIWSIFNISLANSTIILSSLTALMLPFSSSKCYFLPSFVWLFSKLLLYLLAFPQTLKDIWVASGYCRCPSWGPLVLPAVPTPLWCRSLIPCARGGSTSQCTLCTLERTSSNCAASQSTEEMLLGLTMGATNVAEITGQGGEGEKDRPTILEFSGWEE